MNLEIVYYLHYYTLYESFMIIENKLVIYENALILFLTTSRDIKLKGVYRFLFYFVEV